MHDSIKYNLYLPNDGDITLKKKKLIMIQSDNVLGKWSAIILAPPIFVMMIFLLRIAEVKFTGTQRLPYIFLVC